MITTIGFIISSAAAIIFFVLWRGANQDVASAVSGREFYEQQGHKAERQVKDIGKLITKGWVATESWSGWAENWKFQAPDETEPRKFEDALHRQKRLDEIAEYNLPQVYENIDDTQIPQQD